MAKIAKSFGLDPDQAQNIDVVGGALLSRVVAVTRAGRDWQRPSGFKLVGMLQVLLKALDQSELCANGPDGGPIPLAAVVANVIPRFATLQ